MAKLISADDFVEWFLADAITNEQREFAEKVRYAAEKIPTVDAVPVRRGRWIKKRYWSEGVGMGESYGYWYACSECNHEVKGGYSGCSDKFCPHCGARMDGKDGEGGE